MSGSVSRLQATATPTGTKRSGFAWGASRGTVRAPLATRQRRRASRRLLRCDAAPRRVVGGHSLVFARRIFWLASVLHAARALRLAFARTACSYVVLWSFQIAVISSGSTTGQKFLPCRCARSYKTQLAAFIIIAGSLAHKSTRRDASPSSAHFEPALLAASPRW